MTCVLEDNEIEMDNECWGGRGNRKLIKIPSSGHLRYDRFIKKSCSFDKIKEYDGGIDLCS